MTSEKYKGLYEKWDEFLKAWPIDKIKTMSIEEYSKLGDQNSFTYWLEHNLKSLGSIRGGDSSKFGVYSYRKKPKKNYIECHCCPNVVNHPPFNAL